MTTLEEIDWTPDASDPDQYVDASRLGYRRSSSYEGLDGLMHYLELDSGYDSWYVRLTGSSLDQAYCLYHYGCYPCYDEALSEYIAHCHGLCVDPQ